MTVSVDKYQETGVIGLLAVHSNTHSTFTPADGNYNAPFPGRIVYDIPPPHRIVFPSNSQKYTKTIQLHRLFAHHSPTPPKSTRTTAAHLLLVLGSGGHTSEMLSMLHNLPLSRYKYRTYIISSGDHFSAGKARQFEVGLSQRAQPPKPDAENGRNLKSRKGQNAAVHDRERLQIEEYRRKEGGGTYSIHTLPRARRIHQSLLTTPFTSLQCLIASLRLLLCHEEGYPDLVVTNGPATALIVLLAVNILKVLAFLGLATRRKSHRSYISTSSEGTSHRHEKVARQQQRIETGKVGRIKTIYVESWARVKMPSLSLKIVRWTCLCDKVIVQHAPLAEKGWGEWRGDLMI